MGAEPPVGPPQYPFLCRADQGRCRRFRQRRCLLKGCERWFRPCQPQGRYCSQACQREARRWRRWHASRRYRASTSGQAQRREQSQRYRARQRQRLSRVPGAAAAGCAVAGVAVLGAAGVGAPCEGQRPAQDLADFVGRPCSRPGCYEQFPVCARSPHQHFCSCCCRQALRRVLDREAHWRRRHRPARPRRRPASRPPSNSS